ncbi:unnamed protein product [Phytophthora lilii]|uniref:Unnamed protein product n=1 Tax=Phytophthora lilii TaxID=2077276 RepID=A0A9W6WN17_9STRA|nr:unnamed protein product [Phytophthora lilii]
MQRITRSDFQVRRRDTRGENSVIDGLWRWIDRPVHDEMQLHRGVLQLPGDDGEAQTHRKSGGDDEGALRDAETWPLESHRRRDGHGYHVQHGVDQDADGEVRRESAGSEASSDGNVDDLRCKRLVSPF